MALICPVTSSQDYKNLRKELTKKLGFIPNESRLSCVVAMLMAKKKEGDDSDFPTAKEVQDYCEKSKMSLQSIPTVVTTGGGNTRSVEVEKVVNSAQQKAKAHDIVEVSTANNDKNSIGKQFSAKVARFNHEVTLTLGGKKVEIPKGTTIEDAYQKIIKGREDGSRGKPNEGSILAEATKELLKLFPEKGQLGMKFELSKKQLEEFSFDVFYLPLWMAWAQEHIDDYKKLHKESWMQGRLLNDKFAGDTSVSQARAHSIIMYNIITSGKVEGDPNATRQAYKTQASLVVKTANERRGTTIMSFPNQKKTKEQKEKEKADQERLDKFSFEVEDKKDLSQKEKSGQEKLLEMYDAKTLSWRTDMIAYDFSRAIDNILDNEISDTEAALLNGSLTDSERIKLQLYLEELKGSMGRAVALQKVGAKRVLEMIASDYGWYNEQNRERYIQELMDEMDGDSAYDNWTEEDKSALAESNADHRIQEYQKMVSDPDVFRALVIRAMPKIRLREKMKLDFDANTITVADALDLNSDPNGNYGNASLVDPDSERMEEKPNDDAYDDFRTIDAYDHLSAITRQYIMSCIARNADGTMQVDDLGIPITPNAKEVHAKIALKLTAMTDASQMIPLLEELAAEYPTVRGLVDFLKGEEANDPNLSEEERKEELRKAYRARISFYQYFRKDYTNYSCEVTYLDDNGVMHTKCIDMTDKSKSTLAKWANNTTGGKFADLFDDDTVPLAFKKDGTVNYKNLNEIAGKIRALKNKYSRISKIGDAITGDEIFATFTESNDNGENKAIGEILEILTCLGITCDVEHLRTFLIADTPNSRYERNNVNTLLSALGEIVATIDKSNYEKKKSMLVNDHKNLYYPVAQMLQDSADLALSLSVHLNGKTYSTLTSPNYIIGLIKKLKNAAGVMSDEEWEQFINDEFKKYDWFYNAKTGEWRCEWLRLLTGEDGKYWREQLRHKVILARDTKGYEDVNSPEYALMCLKEFFAPGEDLAYYSVPVLSNSPSAEFIRFRRYQDSYLSDDKDNPDGEVGTAVDLINLKMGGVIDQEIARIKLVIQRQQHTVPDATGSVPSQGIKDFDSSMKKTGENEYELKKTGGAEFKFLPELNTYEVTVKVKSESGKGRATNRKMTFLEATKAYIAGRITDAEFTRIKKAAVEDVMAKDCDSEIEHFQELGLFELNDDGIYIYLKELGERISSVKPWDGKGLKDENADMIKALEYIKKRNGKLSGDLARLYYNLTNNVHVGYAESQRLVKSFLQELSDLADASEGNVKGALNKWIKYFSNGDIVDYARDLIQNYVYNRMFATSQIIELSQGDLAFSSNAVKFFKYNKQIYGAGLRLDTEAKYISPVTGQEETVGRKTEYSITIEDEEVTSEQLIKDLEPVILKEHAAGNLTDYNAAFILASYGASNYTKTIDGKEVKYYKIGSTLVKTATINVTDGQAFRSLKSYRDIMIMSGEGAWTDEMEKAYWAIQDAKKNGTPLDMKALFHMLNVSMQTKKPFVYTQEAVDSGVDDETGSGEHKLIKKPIQRKNSEFLLLAAFEALGTHGIKSGERLKGISEFMEKYGIDTVQFASTMKTGAQGVITIPADCKTKEDVMGLLERATGVKQACPDADGVIADDTKLSECVQKTRFSDYSIQTATPEHFLDTVSVIGTQIRKMIGEDIAPETKVTMCSKFTVDKNGHAVPDLLSKVTMTKAEWETFYQQLLTENILQSFSMVYGKMMTAKDIVNLVRDQLIYGSDYDSEMLNAIDIDPETGTFKIPLFDPVMCMKVQQMLLAVIRHNVTQQKIKGGQLIQVSSYGLDEKLKIIFTPEGGVAYAECLMPAWTRKHLEAFMDEDGNIDFDKVPDEIKYMVGYRIPTEGMCSVLPLKVVGFLPQENGSAIMLPEEITTIAGSDFDVDKMFMMFYEYDVEYYEGGERAAKRRAFPDFEAYTRQNNLDLYKDFDEADFKYGLLTEEQWTESQEKPDEEIKGLDSAIRSHAAPYTTYEDYVEAFKNARKARNNAFNDWWYEKGNNETYKLESPRVTKVDSEMSDVLSGKKKIQELSHKQRNNAIIDLMRGMLAIPENTSMLLRPQGYQMHKEASRIFNILSELSSEELIKLMEDAGVDQSLIEKYKEHPSDALLDKNMSYEMLNKMKEMRENSMNILLPSTQHYFQHQNMAGMNLVGTYATHNVGNAILQKTQIAIHPTYAVSLFGRKETNLHAVKDHDGNFISQTIGGYKGASVDNAKDPILAELMQNKKTASITMLLVKLGYTPTEIGALFNQPVIKEAIRRSSGKLGRTKSLAKALAEVQSELEKSIQAQLKAGVSGTVSEKDLTVKNALRLITMGNDIASGKRLSASAMLKYRKSELELLKKFTAFLELSAPYNTIIMGVRAGTTKGGPSKSIIHTLAEKGMAEQIMDMIRQEKVAKESEKEKDPKKRKPHPPIIGLDGLIESTSDISVGDEHWQEKLRARLYGGKVASEQAFWSLGLEHLQDVLGDYFPHFTEWMQVMLTCMKNLAPYKINDEFMDKIYTEFMAYAMTDVPFFGNYNEYSTEEKRKKFVKDFPYELQDWMKKHPDVVKENKLLSHLEVAMHDKGRAEGTPYIIFRNVSNLSKEMRADVTRDWEMLMHSDVEGAYDLALNLFRYSFFRTGFSYGPFSITHLCPIAVRTAIPGYIEGLNTLHERLRNLDPTDHEASKDFDHFFLQFIRNHLGEGIFEWSVWGNAPITGIGANGNQVKKDKIFIDDATSASGVFEQFEIVPGEDKQKGEMGAEATAIFCTTTTDLNGRSVYQARPFIKIRYKGKNYYYMALGIDHNRPEVRTYMRITPLGIRNQYQEYDMSQDGLYMESMLKEFAGE